MEAVVEEIAEMEGTDTNSSPNKLHHSVIESGGVEHDLEDTEVDIKYDPKWNKQRKSYSAAWERNPSFRDWVARHPNDPCRAVCRYCSCTLRAHKTDLKKHMTSNKHKRNQTIFDKNGGTHMLRKSGTFLLKREPQSEVEDPTCSIFGEAINAIHNDTTYMQDDQDDYSITDGEIKDTVNKVGEAFCRDLLRLLRRQKPLVKGLQRSDFSRGEEGVDRMTRLLVAHLAQHYLVESTLDSWRKGGTMTDNMANKLAVVENRMEKYVMEIRNMKLQLESESGRGPSGVTLDTLDLSDLQKTSVSINIMES